jgi:hypothetical protein
MRTATNWLRNYTGRSVDVAREDDASKRLDHLHAIIQRLATNSFTVKGWAVAVASGFLGFAVKDAKPTIAFVGLIPIAIFWIIDAYYLTGERHFRRCYNGVRQNPELATAPIAGFAVRRAELFRALATPIVAGLYMTLILCCVLLGIGLFVVPKP